MNWILEQLRTPSSFRGQPWKFALNQLGHAYLVGGGGVALLWALFDLVEWLLPGVTIPDGAALLIVLVGYAAWEFTQYRYYDAEAADCLEDLAHVGLIATAVAHADAALILPQLLFTAAGVFIRFAEKG